MTPLDSVARVDELSDVLPTVALHVLAQSSTAGVLHTAVQGLVEDYRCAMARIWIVGAPGRSRRRTIRLGEGLVLRLRAEASRRVQLDKEAGRAVMAAPWIHRIASTRTPIQTSRLYHGGDTPDSTWMRSNRFRSFSGHALSQADQLLGVLAVFSRQPFSPRAFDLLDVFSRQLSLILHGFSFQASADYRAPAGATLDEVMKEYIEWTLVQTAGRIEGPDGAARRLNIHPNTLRSRMEKLGVRRS